ncbi:hypothetical protein ACFLTZ_05400 [Chloroflexota bacterium]
MFIIIKHTEALMRLGINIPNILLEQYRPLKDTYNLSKICREAIQKRVESYERAKRQSADDGMEAVADRLWQEYHKKTVLDWEAIGRDDAKNWISLATFEDFENLFHNVAIRNKKGGDLGAFLQYRYIPGTKRYEDHGREHEDWFTRQCELDEDSDPYIWAKTEYYHGWFSYVTAVWQMVKERITADAIARQKERKKAEFRVDVPDNLVKP